LEVSEIKSFRHPIENFYVAVDGRIDDGSVYEHDVRPDGFDGSVK